tara:strand:+ start:40 stop:690 length:651 start_codon:yes stop_codon:yes gene_type:complete
MPEPKKSKYPKIADFIQNLSGMGKYFKTNVPGESELVSRLLGTKPKYNYRNIVNPVDELFESSSDTEKDKKLWDTYMEKSWKQVGNKKYSPDESPLTETKTNVFEVNPKTQFGKNFQKRIDLAFIRSKLIEKDYNPDQGYRKMRKGEEPLLGDIYFEDDGSFTDLWNVSLDPHEAKLTPTNIVRSLLSKPLEMNTPIVKGKASKWAVDYSKNLKNK